MRKPREGPSAVVDTTLFVSGLIVNRGHPYALVEAVRRGEFTPAVSEALYQEYERVLPRRKFAETYGLAPEEVAAFLFLIGTSARRVTPRRRLPVKVRDATDEKVLAAGLGLVRTLGGETAYLVTGDNDLLELRDHPKLKGLQIVTVREFLELLRRGEGASQ